MSLHNETGGPSKPAPSLETHDLSREGFGEELRLTNTAQLPDTPDGTANPEGGGRTELDLVSEAVLLGIMSEQHMHPSNARDAWAELYQRHSRYLLHVTARRHGARLTDPDVISDIAADAFQAAFDWAGRQKNAEDVVERFHDPEPDRTRMRVLGWLSVIAHRIAVHRVAHSREPHVQLHDTETPGPDSEEPPPTAVQPRLARALEMLSADELEALHVSLPWYDPETGVFACPRGEASRIASSIGISTDALRQRRHRCLQHLRSILGERQ